MLKLVLIGALGIGAVAPQEPAAQQRQTPSGPYRQVFEVDRAERGRPPVTLRAKPVAMPSGTEEVVLPSKQHAVERGGCNMPIIPADASVDRGILILKPEGGPEPRIRVIEPKACWKK